LIARDGDYRRDTLPRQEAEWDLRHRSF